MKNIENIWFPLRDLRNERDIRKATKRAKFGYFPEALISALNHVTDWSVAIDGGANVGFWTIDMAKRFEHVYAFEIDPETYECLEKNLDSREIKNCSVQNVGLSNKKNQYQIANGWNGHSMGSHLMPKTLMLGKKRRPDNSRARSKLRPGSKINTITIDSMSLSSLGFVKLDVEGHEAQVLEGGKETLSKYKPIVMIEYKPMLNKRYGDSDPVQILEELGATLITKVGNNDIDWIFGWTEEENEHGK